MKCSNIAVASTLFIIMSASAIFLVRTLINWEQTQAACYAPIQIFTTLSLSYTLLLTTLLFVYEIPGNHKWLSTPPEWLFTHFFPLFVLVTFILGLVWGVQNSMYSNESCPRSSVLLFLPILFISLMLFGNELRNRIQAKRRKKLPPIHLERQEGLIHVLTESNHQGTVSNKDD